MTDEVRGRQADQKNIRSCVRAKTFLEKQIASEVERKKIGKWGQPECRIEVYWQL